MTNEADFAFSFGSFYMEAFLSVSNIFDENYYSKKLETQLPKS